MPTTFALLLPFGGRYVPPYWAVSLASLRWPSNSSHTILHSLGMKRDLARTTLVKKALSMSAEYVIFVDDDTQISGDTIVKLHMALETADEDVMVCAGIYTSKCSPAEPYVYLKEDGAPHWKWRMGDVFPCHSIGTGCMMIKTEVFKHLSEPWFRDIDTVEEARQDPNLSIHPSVGEFRITDDIYFALRLAKAGYKMLAHGGVLPVHWDQEGTPYTLPRDSYPLQGVRDQDLWYSAFGITEGNAINPPRKVELPDGFLTIPEAEELYHLAKDRTVLEFGAFKGRSTVAMALSAKSVTSIDWHGGDVHTEQVGGKIGSTLEEYMANIEPYANVTPIVGRIEDEVPKLAGQKFQMVFVDAAHDKASVIRDMQMAMSFSPEVIAVHDWNLFEVTPAIKSLGLTPARVIGTLAVFEFAAAP